MKMTSRSRKYYCPAVRFFLLLAVSSSLAFAQRGKEIKVKFTSFADPPAGLEFSLSTPKEKDGKVIYERSSGPFELTTDGFTDAYEAPSRECALTFSTAGDPTQKLASKLIFPAPGRHFIVVLVPGENGKPTPKIIRADKSSFADGGVMIMNLGEQTIYAQIEDQKTVIEGGTSHQHKPSKTQNTGTYPAKFGYRTNGKMRVFKSSSWPFSKGRRSFVFFYTKGQGAPHMRGIDEYTSWLKD